MIYTYDGIKMAAVASFPESAWNTSGDNDSEVAELAKQVAWLYGVERKRAGAIAGLPMELRRNGEAVDKKDWPVKMDLPELLYKYSLAMDLYGENYMFKVKRGQIVERVKWFDPTTITIEANDRVGLLGFTRTLGAKKTMYPVKNDDSDVMWTWLPGLAELGPGDPPANVVEDAANILRYMTLTTKGFFERGAIDNWVLFGPQSAIPQGERKSFFAKWKRMMMGGQLKGGSMEVLHPDSRLERINTPIADWVLPELNELKAEHICIAHDTPLMLMRPEQGSDKAMMEETRLMWVNDVIIPQGQRLVDTLNRQLFEALGLELVILAESMNVNQEEEHKKSVSFGNYVNGMIAALNAGSPELVEIAANTLGIDLPEDAIATLERMAEEQEQKREENRQEMAENMAQAGQPEQSDEQFDERKAVEMDALQRFIKNGTYLKRPFTSDILTPDEIEAAIVAHDWRDYP